MPEATVMNAGHEVKDSPPEAKRPWRLVRLVDGNGEKYGTFNQQLGTLIIGTQGRKLDITWETDSKGNNLKTAAEHLETGPAGGGEYQRELSPVAQRRVSILNTIGHAVETVNAQALREEENLSVAERWRRTQILAVQMMDFAFELAEKDPANDPFETVDDGVEFAPELPSV